jgi:hypothetical protein
MIGAKKTITFADLKRDNRFKSIILSKLTLKKTNTKII